MIYAIGTRLRVTSKAHAKSNMIGNVVSMRKKQDQASQKENRTNWYTLKFDDNSEHEVSGRSLEIASETPLCAAAHEAVGSGQGDEVIDETDVSEHEDHPILPRRVSHVCYWIE